MHFKEPIIRILADFDAGMDRNESVTPFLSCLLPENIENASKDRLSSIVCALWGLARILLEGVERTLESLEITQDEMFLVVKLDFFDLNINFYEKKLQVIHFFIKLSFSFQNF